MSIQNKVESKLGIGLKPEETEGGGHASASCFRIASSHRGKRLVICSLWLVVFLTLLTAHHSAKAQASFPPIQINLNYPQYQRLKLDGGYHYISDAGLSGIILYRESEERYIAYERRCSVDDDAPVTVDSSGLFMKGCESTFGFSDGYPTGGPVRNPLLKYRVSLNGSNLTITDEVVF